jgi:hypothetical protein
MTFSFNEIASETSHTIYFAKPKTRDILKKKNAYFRPFFNGKKYELNPKETFLVLIPGFSLETLKKSTIRIF